MSDKECRIVRVALRSVLAGRAVDGGYNAGKTVTDGIWHVRHCDDCKHTIEVGLGEVVIGEEVAKLGKDLEPVKPDRFRVASLEAYLELAERAPARTESQLRQRNRGW